MTGNPSIRRYGLTDAEQHRDHASHRLPHWWAVLSPYERNAYNNAFTEAHLHVAVRAELDQIRTGR